VFITRVCLFLFFINSSWSLVFGGGRKKPSGSLYNPLFSAKDAISLSFVRNRAGIFRSDGPNFHPKPSCHSFWGSFGPNRKEILPQGISAFHRHSWSKTVELSSHFFRVIRFSLESHSARLLAFKIQKNEIRVTCSSAHGFPRRPQLRRSSSLRRIQSPHQLYYCHGDQLLIVSWRPYPSSTEPTMDHIIKPSWICLFENCIVYIFTNSQR